MINLEDLKNNEEFQWAYEDWYLRKYDEVMNENIKNGTIPKMSQVEYMRRVVGINVPDDWKRKSKYSEDEKMLFAYLKSKNKKDK